MTTQDAWRTQTKCAAPVTARMLLYFEKTGGSYSLLYASILSFILTFEYFLFGPMSFLYAGEDGVHNIPARILFAHEWQRGLFGFWGPFFGTGADRISQLFPVSIDIFLFKIVPPWLIVGLTMFARSMIGIYFVTRLLNEYHDVPYLVSITCGFSFVIALELNGYRYFAGWTLHLLPVSIWCLRRCANKSLFFAATLGALIGVPMAIGMHIYSWPNIFVFSVLAFFSKERQTKAQLAYILCLAISFAIAIVPIIAALVLLFLDSQAPLGTSFQVAPFSYSWLKFIADPLLYGFSRLKFLHSFSPVFIFTIVIFLLVVKPSRDTAVYLILILFIASVAVLDQDLRSLTAFFELNFIARALLKITSVYSFVLMMAFALITRDINNRYRFELISAAGNRIPFRSYYVVVLIVLIQNCYFVAINKKANIQALLNGANHTTFYLNQTLIKFRQETINEEPFRVVMLQFQNLIGGDVLWSYGFETFDSNLTFQPRNKVSYWSSLIAPGMTRDANVKAAYEQRMLNSGFATYLFAGPEGCSGFRLGNYTNLNLLALGNVKYVISLCPLLDPELSLISSSDPSARKAWENLSMRNKLKAGIAGKYPGRMVRIYKLHNAFPRAFIAGCLNFFPDTAHVQEWLEEASAFTLRKEAATVQSGEPEKSTSRTCQASAAFSDDSAHISSYTADRIIIETRTEQPGTLVVSNQFAPGWTARVDGKPAEILPVNLLFQGVSVHPSAHQVVFEYRPPYLSWGSY